MILLVAKCGRCERVLWEGDFCALKKRKDLSAYYSRHGTKKRYSFRDLAMEVISYYDGVCPTCGKILNIPKSIEVKVRE